MKPFLILSLAALCVAVPAAAVEGQKLDSGLGDLPHYSQWADKSGRQPVTAVATAATTSAAVAAVRVPGESLDDGLGELPHYSKWLDKSGRDPMGREAARVASAAR